MPLQLKPRRTRPVTILPLTGLAAEIHALGLQAPGAWTRLELIGLASRVARLERDNAELQAALAETAGEGTPQH
jgi:hypothetical protein